MPFSVCPSFCFFYNCLNCLFAEMGYFFVFHNFLRNKNCNLVSVFFCIRNCFFHIDFVAIAAYSAPQCRVHVLYCLIISCCNKNEVAWHWLCPYHCACASFTLPGNCKFSFLQCRKQFLLGCRLQGCNLVNKQYAKIGLVNHS